ncbi:aldehyde ferredoxin oxidoreductase family protein [Chloroflexota bacterium]
MMYGYNGKVLFVNLTDGVIKEESVPESIYREYIGGQGLGVRILYERMKPRIDPLGPDNMLGFLTGPLTGTAIHGARFQTVAKSPLTGGWGDANSGGSLAPVMKAGGYDGVFFSGISEKPVYVFINNGKAEILDASRLWGMDTTETAEAIQEELGDDKVKVACIGPAGEAVSLMAAIRHEGSCAARSGIGAVMGSKRLKAFVVKGTKKVTMADPEGFAKLRKEYLKSVKETDHPWVAAFKQWGTCAFLSPFVMQADSPMKNWSLYSEEHYPNHAQISGDAITDKQYKKHACTSCPLGCKGWCRFDTKYGPVESSKLEYETLSMMGPNLMIDDLGAIAKANHLCNMLGIDTIGVGSVIGFAMECYERGVITKEDTDGIELTWGNSDAVVALTEKIGRRDGFGAVLADGAKLAAERIGKGSAAWAFHVGGQDLPAHDARVATGYGWGYQVDPTPGRHTASQVKQGVDGGVPTSPKGFHVDKVDPFDEVANAQVYALCSDVDRLWASAGLCLFGLYPGTMPLAEAIAALTGWDFTLDEGLKAGRRIQTLRQAFNMREGIDTKEWKLPDRLMGAQNEGPNKGRKLDLVSMKRLGYQALGWDPDTGQPLEESLEELGLKELVG